MTNKISRFIYLFQGNRPIRYTKKNKIPPYTTTIRSTFLAVFGIRLFSTLLATFAIKIHGKTQTAINATKKNFKYLKIKTNSIYDVSEDINTSSNHRSHNYCFDHRPGLNGSVKTHRCRHFEYSWKHKHRQSLSDRIWQMLGWLKSKTESLKEGLFSLFHPLVNSGQFMGSLPQERILDNGRI